MYNVGDLFCNLHILLLLICNENCHTVEQVFESYFDFRLGLQTAEGYSRPSVAKEGTTVAD